ncbi:MAG: CDP-diacylglycerol--glycerol-3-phosphate 3-phosphatidyltransferase [Lachnospiraceae bacterium]|nr:CDP-diacylglycerol--glycerol-3-phosphate 3-phosphatidyltransferase [Candidatus Merdinaster equi]
MNLPNKLTTLRVILIPFFVVALLVPMFGEARGEGICKWIALGIFAIASFTDFLDGQIARKRNLVTNFGKFMDPLADKLLVCSAMICLVDLGRLESWIVIIIIAREFTISGFRLIASDNGVVIAASYWGKFKTVFQMVMVILMIMNLPFCWFYITTEVIKWIALALTIISLVDYLIKNRKVMLDQK